MAPAEICVAVAPAVPGRGDNAADGVVNNKGEHDDDDDKGDDNEDDEVLAKQGSEAHNFGSGQDPGVAKARPGTLVAEKSLWRPKVFENQKCSKQQGCPPKYSKSTKIPKPLLKMVRW